MEYKLNKFKQILSEENQKHNLISRKSFSYELDQHIEDSLKILEFIQLEEEMIDIGSGAGFPGMILAIACPRTKITLVESNKKKSDFLKKVRNELALSNVKISCERVEELGRQKEYRGQYSLCSSRAVASTNVLIEYGLPLLKVGGKLLLWKGNNYKLEIDMAQNALRLIGGSLEHVWLYTLMKERDRAIIAITKDLDTPEKYPRRIGIPLKRPL
ncbi:MAG: 16S rRNA (guanine(527)-N(7))-methyltransferase RsmG [Syntrophomonadaceae bacterium]|jgi:16S rRNA (guanine527-N7)-methyltransferase